MKKKTIYLTLINQPDKAASKTFVSCRAFKTKEEAESFVKKENETRLLHFDTARNPLTVKEYKVRDNLDIDVTPVVYIDNSSIYTLNKGVLERQLID